jgi:hypothetical protein
MTEDEWRACANPRQMLDHLHRYKSRLGARKLRLFAAACQGRADAEAGPAPPRDDPPPGPNAATSVDAYLARLVDLCGIDVLQDFRPPELPPRDAREDAFRDAVKAAEAAALTAFRAAHGLERGRALGAARRAQAALVRDLVGNPFRPVAFNPRWRTSDVVGLARSIYDDRAFERMPLLADALMDAGCGDEQVVRHCREPGPHVRGCWVVDAILGLT